MGLFGGKKTYVSSTVYNMAGNINERPNFLKSLVVGNVLTSSNFSMSDTLVSGYTKGPGIKLRSFARWSQGDYSDLMGVASGNLNSLPEVDIDTLAENISHDPDETVWIQKAVIDNADYKWWADQWMLEHHLDLITTEWDADIDDLTNEITITFADLSAETFTPTGFNPDEVYIYAAYSKGYLVHHDEVPGDPEAEPPTETIPAYDERLSTKVDVFFYQLGSGNAELDAMFVPEEDTSFYFPVIPLRLDNKFVGPDKDQWSISELDEDSTEEQIDTAFEAKQDALPVEDLPINFPEIYPAAKRALKKATGGKFDKVVTNVAKNISLKDIDYTYIVFGVSLNTKERAAKKYMFRYFNKLMDSQGESGTATWEAQLDAYNAASADWSAWEQGGSVGPEPVVPDYPSQPTKSVHIKANGPSAVNYDVTLEWSGMARATGSGLAKPSAVAGEYWFEKNTDLEFSEVIVTGKTETGGDVGELLEKFNSMNRVTLYHQIDELSWEAIAISGFTHNNKVYKNKSVVIKASEALDDEDESGFIIPLHYETFTDMSLADSTQMGTACAYLVFNSYKVVKQKWYQTGIFKILVFVVVIAISVLFPPFGAAAGGSGVLGSAVSVGLALGATVATAAIVGAIANAIAAMLIMKLLSTVSTAVFGEKFGAIIGAIASVVAITVGAGIANGSNISASMAQLSSASGIIAMTSAVGQGIQGYIGATIQEIGRDLTKLQEETQEKLQTLEELYAANIGSDRAFIDPMQFVLKNVPMYETSDTFLSRTLMTGSDIADFSLGLLTNFVDVTITTDLP